VRNRALLPLSLALSLASVWPAAAQVDLAIRDGRVSLTATNASLRQILAEWERVGQTRIVNADRVSAEPLTLQFADLSEEQALAVLLRSVSGYLAAPRANPIAAASRFDRIMVMPTSSRPRPAAPAQPVLTPPISEPLTVAPAAADVEDPDGDRPVRTVPAPGPRGGIFSAFPPPQYAPQQPAPASAAPPTEPAYSTRPTVPAGVAVPGMIPPAPRESNQPTSPSQPPG
jgi:hypothetical protein